METSTELKPYVLNCEGILHVCRIKAGKYSTGNLKAENGASIHLINNGLSFNELLTMECYDTGTFALGTEFEANSLKVKSKSSTNIQAKAVLLNKDKNDSTCQFELDSSSTVVMYIDFNGIKEITGSVKNSSTLVIYAKHTPINNIEKDASSNVTIHSW